MQSSSLSSALAAPLLLAGCVSINYAPPTGENTATVVFTTPDKTINNPVMLHTDQCTDKDAKLVGLLNSRAIGVPPVSSIETRVAAGQMLSVSMVAGKFSSSATEIEIASCRRIVDFTPKPKARYEVSFYLVGSTCRYDVLEVVTDANGTTKMVPELTAKVRDSCRLRQSWAPF
jgi:hypothetical protein